MSGQPTFSADCAQAFNMMNTQESPNDYFVCGFDGNTHGMKLIDSGRGGMARVKDILREQFADQTAVAMFRVTAVDDRENTVSYRTKLIHVIYCGPNTPVMKRAKIGPFNSAFKQPFTFNLSIQTSDEDGDLNEAAIEKSLRASGGAHQPTSFDFTNLAAGEGDQKGVRKEAGSRSPTHSPAAAFSPPKASPPPKAEAPAPVASSPVLSVDDIMHRHSEAFENQDAEALALDYAEDSRLYHVDGAARRTNVFIGAREIAKFYTWLWSTYSGSPDVLKMETQGANVLIIEWAQPSQGIAYASDMFYVVNGKIAVQTITTVSGEAPAVSAEATSDGPQDMYDGVEKEAEALAEEAVGDQEDPAEEEQAPPAQEEAAPASSDDVSPPAEGSAEWEAIDKEDAAGQAADEPPVEAPAGEETAEEAEATEADIPTDEVQQDEFDPQASE